MDRGTLSGHLWGDSAARASELDMRQRNRERDGPDSEYDRRMPAPTRRRRLRPAGPSQLPGSHCARPRAKRDQAPSRLGPELLPIFDRELSASRVTASSSLASNRAARCQWGSETDSDRADAAGPPEARP